MSELAETLDLHQLDYNSRDRGCICGGWRWEMGTSHSDHVAAELIKVYPLVPIPDAKNPGPALWEAAYVMQDSLATPPTQDVLDFAEEMVQSYIDARSHTKVHVLGHDDQIRERERKENAVAVGTKDEYAYLLYFVDREFLDCPDCGHTLFRNLPGDGTVSWRHASDDPSTCMINWETDLPGSKGTVS